MRPSDIGGGPGGGFADSDGDGADGVGDRGGERPALLAVQLGPLPRLQVGQRTGQQRTCGRRRYLRCVPTPGRPRPDRGPSSRGRHGSSGRVRRRQAGPTRGLSEPARRPRRRWPPVRWRPAGLRRSGVGRGRGCWSPSPRPGQSIRQTAVAARIWLTAPSTASVTATAGRDSSSARAWPSAVREFAVVVGQSRHRESGVGQEVGGAAAAQRHLEVQRGVAVARDRFQQRAGLAGRCLRCGRNGHHGSQRSLHAPVHDDGARSRVVGGAAGICGQHPDRPTAIVRTRLPPPQPAPRDRRRGPGRARWHATGVAACRGVQWRARVSEGRVTVTATTGPGWGRTATMTALTTRPMSPAPRLPVTRRPRFGACRALTAGPGDHRQRAAAAGAVRLAGPLGRRGSAGLADGRRGHAEPSPGKRSRSGSAAGSAARRPPNATCSGRPGRRH